MSKARRVKITARLTERGILKKHISAGQIRLFEASMLLNFKEFTALHSGGCRNTYFQTTGNEGNGEQNKLDKVKINRWINISIWVTAHLPLP